MVKTFCSHDDIKKVKEIFSGLLNKDFEWRRDPDKKGKDLTDLLVLEFRSELRKGKIKMNFVTDSHKTLPLVGIQVFAPVLTNLSEEIARINDMLPKILEIRYEVLNTVDVARDIKIDICELKT